MKKTFSVQTFLKLAFFEGLASLLILFMIPSDPKNAWLWGFSKSRLSMAAFGMFLVGVVGIFSWRLVKNTPRLKRFSRQIEAAVQREGHLFNGIVFSAAGFLSGSYFIWVTLTTTNLFVKGYFIRLAPWVFWATLICAQTTVFLFQQNWPRSRQFLGKNWKALLSIFVILFSGILFHAGLWGLEPTDWDVHKMFNQDNKFDLIQQDIYAVFVEGDRLQQGINPYARALDLEGDLQWNATNATYMPVFYLLSWLTQKIGLEDFIQWVGFWRVIFLIANLGSAYLMFYVGYRHFQSLVLGAFAALLWLFNRWSIHMTMIYHIDFVAIFFFILSLNHRISRFCILRLIVFFLHFFKNTRMCVFCRHNKN